MIRSKGVEEEEEKVLNWRDRHMLWISHWDVRGLGTENNFKQEETVVKNGVFKVLKSPS